MGDHMRPYLRAANVTWRGLDLSDVMEMDFRPSEFETYELHSGDILLAEASGSASEVGKPAVWRGERKGVCFQNTLIRVRARDPKLVPFLHWHFQHDAHTGRFAAASRGVGIHHLGAEAMSGWEIVVPPLPEQRRIVEALDTHFTRLNAAVATLKRVRANLKRYQAAALQAAIEGRLLAASGLHLDADCPGTESLPEAWHWSALVDLCESITDGDHMPPPQAPTGVPFLVIGDVRTGAIDFSGARFVPQVYFDALDASRRPRRGDVLYTVTGSFGIPVRVRTDRPFCVQRHIAILRPRQEIGDRFLALWLATPYVLRQVGRVATGTAQKTVGLRPLRKIIVPVPPKVLRGEIVDAAERILSICAAAVGQVDRTEARIARLRQSLLRVAFDGRLLPQDPRDEPASVLLERIRAEPVASSFSQKKRSARSRR